MNAFFRDLPVPVYTLLFSGCMIALSYYLIKLGKEWHEKAPDLFWLFIIIDVISFLLLITRLSEDKVLPTVMGRVLTPLLALGGILFLIVLFKMIYRLCKSGEPNSENIKLLKFSAILVISGLVLVALLTIFLIIRKNN